MKKGQRWSLFVALQVKYSRPRFSPGVITRALFARREHRQNGGVGSVCPLRAAAAASATAAAAAAADGGLFAVLAPGFAVDTALAFPLVTAETAEWPRPLLAAAADDAARRLALA
jgi:hypothetical protein